MNTSASVRPRTRALAETAHAKRVRLAELVGRLVLTHQVCADTAALGNLKAVLFRPGTYRRTVNARRGYSTRAAAIPASAYPAAGLDIRGKVLYQPGVIIRAQVDLVCHAV